MIKLNDVIKYFKDASIVKCIDDSNTFDINVPGKFLQTNGNKWIFRFERKQKGVDHVAVYEHGTINIYAEIISHKQTDVFDYPLEMSVSDDGETWSTRVVFMDKNNKYIAWASAQTINESEDITDTVTWKYAKHLPAKVFVSMAEIAQWQKCEIDRLKIVD